MQILFTFYYYNARDCNALIIATFPYISTKSCVNKYSQSRKFPRIILQKIPNLKIPVLTKIYPYLIVYVHVTNYELISPLIATR